MLLLYRQGRWSNGRRCRLGCRQKPHGCCCLSSFFAMAINERQEKENASAYTAALAAVDLKINKHKRHDSLISYGAFTTSSALSSSFGRRKSLYFVQVMDGPFVSLRTLKSCRTMSFDRCSRRHRANLSPSGGQAHAEVYLRLCAALPYMSLSLLCRRRRRRLIETSPSLS